MRARVLLAVPAILLVAGCSQAAAIAPVGGNRLAEVRYAGNDVLVSRGVSVLVAPVCSQDGDEAVRCTGRTAAGEPITVVAPAADPPAVRVTVTAGPTTLYDGPLQTVLDDAARPPS